MNDKKLKKIYYILPFLSIGMLIILWVVISNKNSFLLPTPEMVWARLVKLFEHPVKKTSLLGHSLASIKRVMIALVFAWVLGISFGILIGWNKKCKALFGSMFELFRPIPPIAWIPLIIMWFGIGEFPKVIIVFIGTFTPVVINTYTGITLVDKINIDVGKAFNGSQMKILWEIVVPTAIPSIFAGIRTSVSSGWTTVLAAEMLGANKGLGFLVQRGWESGDIPLVLVAMICIGIVGAILAILLNAAERWVCPWNVKQVD